MDKQQEIIDLCNLMVNEKFDLIEGCRLLVSLRHYISDPENSVFFSIRAIDSETDHFPIGSMREHCSEEFLKKSDKERTEYLQDVKPDIISSCKEVLDFLM